MRGLLGGTPLQADPNLLDLLALGREVTASMTHEQIVMVLYLHLNCTKRTISCGVRRRISEYVLRPQVFVDLRVSLVQIFFIVREESASARLSRDLFQRS